MTVGLQKVIQSVGQIVARDGLAQLADIDLLRLYETNRDSTAFEILVRRHGAMVLGVCRRVLGQFGDADDAFQATFLALIQHSRSIRADGSLAGWLYCVARRMSIRTNRLRISQARTELLAARPERVTGSEVEQSDWLAMLDREIERLPKCYRDAFILCHLEGQAQDAAARQLGCPLGTLQSRLARAKERLRARLSPTIQTLAPFALGVVSPLLVKATVSAAIKLSQGLSAAIPSTPIVLSKEVGKPMFLIKAKCLLMIVLAASTIGSSAVFLHQPVASATAPTTTSPPAEPTIEELKRENERLRREVATLKRQVGELKEEAALLRGDDVPTDAEILSELTRRKVVTKEAFSVNREDIIIVKNMLCAKLDPVRNFPLVGNARIRHRHWECTVYYTEIVERNGPNSVSEKKLRVQVIYIDKDNLVNSSGQQITISSNPTPPRTGP